MRSLWESKTYTRNPASPKRYFKAGLDLYKDVMWIPVGQMVAKIQVGGLEKKLFCLATYTPHAGRFDS